jgi:Fic family protein
MYIYKKRINNKTYYYLRLSKRDGNRIIVEDIANLGTDPDKILNKINSLDKKYSSQIRKSIRNINRTIDYEHFKKKVENLKLKYDEFLDYDDLVKIETSKLHFNNKILKLDNKTKEEYIENFSSEYAWNTASIEGNTIPLKDAQKYFVENLTPKNAKVEEMYDLRNNKDSIKYLFNNIDDLDISRISINFIHSLIVKDVDKRLGYRTFDVRVLNSRFKSSPFQYIQEDMEELIKWYSKYKYKYHPFVLASIFHHKFEQIHPFADGNGRTGRILFNYILMINNYPPLIVQKKNRTLYLDSLSKSDKGNFKNPNKKIYNSLFSYLVLELEKTYWQYFS